MARAESDAIRLLFHLFIRNRKVIYCEGTEPLKGHIFVYIIYQEFRFSLQSAVF